MGRGKIIAIVNTKGGTGKSTLAVNLARALEGERKKVALVDADPQQSCWAWANIRNNLDAGEWGSRFTVVAEPRADRLSEFIPHIAGIYDYVVIDGPPRLGGIIAVIVKMSDLALIPIGPSVADILSTAQLLELQEALFTKTPSALVICRQIVGTRLAADVRRVLRTYGLPIARARISQRVAYVEAFSVGRAVTDYAPRSKATAEVRALAKEVKRMLKRHGKEEID